MSDDDRPDRTRGGSVYASEAATAPHRRGLQRRQTAIGIAGAIAVLVGSGFIVTQLMDARQDTLPEPAALAPLTTAATPGMEGTGVSAVPGNLRAPRTTHPAEAAKRAPSPTPMSLPEEPGASAPYAPSSMAVAQQGQQAPVIRRVETVHNGTVRISTARADLTGRGDLQLAADTGFAAGDGIRCTNRVRFSPDEPATTREYLLLCWRTSDRRSVITMAVAAHGAPTPADSAKIIIREWDSLG
ncbi:Neuronal acetylcholine receptor subunit alpha-4 [Actinoplanes sp. SE50]|uniref:hypothetical protein n=1 Tax=unclassified Actinoplanes TaxID=2626549 RepID=UPI00023EC516|nr:MULTISPECIES: hypothetical protein [unclassified Actinoplanes]AEV87585.1 Neuronal acetylcholine receptor subunit alpha-4 [Actinoplanes sp. SE50/110]ATO85988.1 Neuronal acetylcholine receptor subunit alpha-4 [Actinoplanes sp. SE50]SLM03402.1 Neuronal acetylcholine receptor subunit alpha-4 [Actinoplanes sp. SE50/110]